MAFVIGGDVEIVTPHGVARLRGGQDGGAVLDVPAGPEGEQALRGFLESIGGREGIRRGDDVLRRMGIGVRLEQEGRTLAVLGAGATGSRLGRAAGIGDAEVRLGALLRMVAGR
jgi:hypothetical protein